MTTRLSAVETSLLHVEDAGGLMHLASFLLFDGDAPPFDQLLEQIEARLHLVPRFRQRLARVPLAQGRPEWADDTHFNLRYHVRHHAVPPPGGERELQTLTARLLGLRLDRSKPLWEIALIEGLEDGGFALLIKVHQTLVDGAKGIGLLSLLLDDTPQTVPGQEPAAWTPRPLPSPLYRVTDALTERFLEQGRVIGQTIGTALRHPTAPLHALGEEIGALADLAASGVRAPHSPLNVPIGPHRRYTWIDAEFAALRAVAAHQGVAVSDVVYASVALGLRRWLHLRGAATAGLVLRALVPITRRRDEETGRQGPGWVELPVGIPEPLALLAAINAQTSTAPPTRQIATVSRLARLADLAGPLVLGQAARLQPRQRFCNLVVANGRGPETVHYLAGRPLRRIFPVAPLAQNLALGIASVSYNGRLGYGLTADYDAIPDVDQLAAAIAAAIDELAAASGVAMNGSTSTPGWTAL